MTGMPRADELLVVLHDDTVSRFLNVRYTLARDGLRVIDAAGRETLFPAHEVLHSHALLSHSRFRTPVVSEAA